jgi:hypothetical protein
LLTATDEIVTAVVLLFVTRTRRPSWTTFSGGL